MTDSDQELNQSNGQMEESIQNSGDNNHPNQKNQKETVNVDVNLNELNKIRKEYKKIKKYMRSPLFAVKVMDGTETYLNKLLNEL